MTSVTQFHGPDVLKYISHSVMSNSLQCHGLQSTGLLYPWNSPGKNTGVGCHFLLQGIFLIQGSNPGLLHCRQTLYHLSHPGNTWSNRQIWPWSTEWSRAKANRVLPREHACHSKHPLPTTQVSTRGHHQMVNTKSRLIILFAAKDGEALHSQQKQDRELLWLRSWAPYCQIQTEIEQSRENRRPFTYDLNQSPYDYTVGVRDRVKG